MADQRALPVPDGLAGERVDVALTRLFGLSRGKAADLVASGAVQVDGATPSKADRVHAGSWLEVELPDPPRRAEVRAEAVEGLVIVLEDDDLVVVDKPVGVAAHPSPGWTGPTVLAGLAAAGVRVATSGAAERQGIVHRSTSAPAA